MDTIKGENPVQERRKERETILNEKRKALNQKILMMKIKDM